MFEKRYCCPDCGRGLTFDSVEVDLKNLMLSERPAYCKRCDRYYYRAECVVKDDKCECKEKDCKESICRGDCGCGKCHRDYQDFLSWDRG